MAKWDLFDALAEGIIDLAEFSDAHPYVWFGMKLTAVVGSLWAWMKWDEYTTPRPDNGYDPAAVRRRQAEELARLEWELKQSLQDKLHLAHKTLKLLRDQKRLDQVAPDFKDRLQTQTDIHHVLYDMSEYQARDHKEEIIAMHQSVAELYKEYLAFDEMWQEAQGEWLAGWNQVSDLLARGRKLQVPVDTAEGKKTVTVDCDFWSRGALSEAGKALPHWDQPEDTTIDDFNSLSQEADRIYRQLTEIMEQAVQAFMAGQIRVRVSQSIYESLCGRGWYLDEEGYYAFAGYDERGTLELKLYSPGGDRVEFTLQPDNSVQMRPVFQGVRNRAVAQQLLHVLQDALQSSGVSVQDARLA